MADADVSYVCPCCLRTVRLRPGLWVNCRACLPWLGKLRSRMVQVVSASPTDKALFHRQVDGQVDGMGSKNPILELPAHG